MIGPIAGDIIASPFRYNLPESPTEIFFNLFEESTKVNIDMKRYKASTQTHEAKRTLVSGIVMTVERWLDAYENSAEGWQDAVDDLLPGERSPYPAELLVACGPVVAVSESEDVAVAAVSLLFDEADADSESLLQAIAFTRALYALKTKQARPVVREMLAGAGLDLSMGTTEIRPFITGFVMRDRAGRLTLGDKKSVETVPMVLQAAFAAFNESNSFEETVRRASIIGGNTSLVAAVAASMAEFSWGVPALIRERTEDYLSIPEQEAQEDFYRAMRRSFSKDGSESENEYVDEGVRISVLHLQGMRPVYLVPEDMPKRERILSAIADAWKARGNEYEIETSVPAFNALYAAWSVQTNADGVPLVDSYIERPRPTIRHIWFQEGALKTAVNRKGMMPDRRKGHEGEMVPLLPEFIRRNTFRQAQELSEYIEKVRSFLDGKRVLGLNVTGYEDGRTFDVGIPENYLGEGRHFCPAEGIRVVGDGFDGALYEGTICRGSWNMSDYGTFEIDPHAQGGHKGEGIEGIIATRNLLPENGSPDDVRRVIDRVVLDAEKDFYTEEELKILAEGDQGEVYPKVEAIQKLHASNLDQVQSDAALLFTRPEVTVVQELDMEKYLSGAVKGIGPASVRKIMDKFGPELPVVLDYEPDRLLEVQGVPEAKLQELVSFVRSDKAVRQGTWRFYIPGDVPGGFVGEMRKSVMERHPFLTDDSRIVVGNAPADGKFFSWKIPGMVEIFNPEKVAVYPDKGRRLSVTEELRREEKRMESIERNEGKTLVEAERSQAYKGAVFTVGYGKMELPTFVSLMKTYGIELLVDIRTHTYSKFHKEFNESYLNGALENVDIEYVHVPEFGGRQAKNGSKSVEMTYDEVFASEGFRRKADVIREKVAGGMRIALMCSEANPLECHRYLMMGQAFAHPEMVGSAAEPLEVRHIRSKFIAPSQEELDVQLLNYYGFDRIGVDEQQPSINIYYGAGQQKELSNFAPNGFFKIVPNGSARAKIGAEISMKAVRLLLTQSCDTLKEASQNTGIPEELLERKRFYCVEHAYQYCKGFFAELQYNSKGELTHASSTSLYELRKVLEQLDKDYREEPEMYRKYGRLLKGIDMTEWDKVNYDLMYSCVKAAFDPEKCPSAWKALDRTGDYLLTHKQDDTRWAEDFPEILIRIRTQYRKEGYGKEYPESELVKPDSQFESERDRLGRVYHLQEASVRDKSKRKGYHVWRPDAQRKSKGRR